MKPEARKTAGPALARAAAALVLPILISCAGEKTMDPLSLSLQRLRAVPQERWDALSGRRVFFGHQSVGANVLSGVRTVLADTPGVRLELVEASDPGALDRPVLAHAFIGRNGDPMGKIDHFRSLLENGIG